jgi:hypothetical protein
MIENYRNALARGDENEKKRHLKKEAKVNEKVTLVILICLALILGMKRFSSSKKRKNAKSKNNQRMLLRKTSCCKLALRNVILYDVHSYVHVNSHPDMFNPSFTVGHNFLLGHSFPSSTISLLLLYVNSSLVSTETLQRKLIIKSIKLPRHKIRSHDILVD